MTFIYGKRPVAEAERGKRRVHQVWKAPGTSAEELERLCGSPDHQGVVAEVDPYPYADPAGRVGSAGVERARYDAEQGRPAPAAAPEPRLRFRRRTPGGAS